MKTKEQRIEELKAAMKVEAENNFPNGDAWNNMADELNELERVPSVFETLNAILNSPIDHEE